MWYWEGPSERAVHMGKVPLGQLWVAFDVTRTSRHVRRLSSPGRGCDAALAPRPGRPCSRSSPQPRSAAPSSDARSATRGESAPRSCLLETRSCGPNRASAEAQAYVDVVRHAVNFQQFNSLLPTQLSQNSADLFAKPDVKDYLPVLWYDHHLILTLPLQLGQTLPFVHRKLLSPGEPSPRKNPCTFSCASSTLDAPKLFGSHGQRPWFNDLIKGLSCYEKTLKLFCNG